MSPSSARVESLCATYGVPPLEALEYFLERAAIRQYEGGQSREVAESGALTDTEVWAKLWIALKVKPSQQARR